MLILWISLGVIAVALLVLGGAFYCYKRVFYIPDRTPLGEDEYELPDGEEYEAHREQIIEWIKATRTMPHERVCIRSRDGLKLCGKYYEYQAGAPIELLFHGYRGSGERDLSGGVERCFKLGRNALLIDQRAGGESEGNVTTFGIKEKEDCLEWIRFAIERFGKDVLLFVGGISMGAATVLMVSAEELPENVVCILADSAYTSPKEIIQKVIRDMKLPAKLVYPFVRLGAILFGKFDPDAYSPLQAVERARVPIVFLHGDADGFVPFAMSERLYAHCASKKAFVALPNAGHGLGYPVAPDLYLQALKDFEIECKTAR